MSRLGFFYLLLAASFALAVIVAPPPLPADQSGPAVVPGELIVKFKKTAGAPARAQAVAEVGTTLIKSFPLTKAELHHVDGITVDEAVSRLRSNPSVEYAEPNYIWTAEEVPNDPMFPQLYAMENTGQTGGTPGADISATNAWDVFTGSDQVVIGVIDTGVDYLHPDLAANIYTNPGEIPGNSIDDDLNGYVDDVRGWDFINNDNDPMDDNGHGSHCSGTIGGVGNNGIGVAGVCWTVRIMPLKFLSAGGSGSTDDAIEAVEYATMMGARLTSNSWGGGGFSQGLYDAIQAANAAGILFIAAAGNNGANTDVSPHYPSSYDLPNIVAVAATDHNDDLADFSNYGATTVDLAAPGVNILSTFPGNSYGSISGTSMATPHVSGAFGLVFGRLPGIGHLDAKNLVLNFVDPIPDLSGVVLTGGRLNVFMPIAEPDSIPPSAVLDLAVTGAASNSIDLAWTAPGDDGGTGTAAAYDVRVATSPITEGTFLSATPVAHPPDPGLAGSAESMTVDGLDFSTTYYFAVRGRDEFGNVGSVSNSPSGTTLGAPDAAVTPTSLSETLLTGATSMQSLLLENVASNSTLDFDIPLPDLVTAPTALYEYVEVAKGAVDPRQGDPVLQGTGGPDAFGYRWADSDEPFGPAFAWTDISGTGTTVLSSGDDANAGPFPVGFNFSFYGVDYNQFRVCSNGWLSFSSSATTYNNQPLPNAGAPEALVAPFWDDLLLSPGTIQYQSDGARLIVQWTNVAHYGGGGPYSFQAILYADGTIEYQYLSMGSPDNSATVGIQNAAMTDGLTVAFNAGYVHDNLAVRIQAVPQWLAVSPTAGRINGPGSTSLAVSFDASGLLGGTYEGNIRILSNDPDENPLTVPVTLVVTGAPDIAVEPAAHDFGQVFFGLTPSTVFQVRNPGTDILHVSNVASSSPAYVPDQTVFAVPPHGSVVVNVMFNPPALGMYPATLTVTSDDPDQPTVAVSLNGEAVVPPNFSVTPTSLISNLFTGMTEIQALTIRNTGGAPLVWNVDVDLGEQVAVDGGLDLAKGEADPRPGILGNGGPDAFGYRWIDSDDPGGPVFSWVDISGTGTAIFTATTDDGNRGPFPIGFNFPFYGNPFSTFRLCSNGWVSFTSTSTDLSNDPIPSAGSPENLLAAFHDDLVVDLARGSQVYYQYDGTRLIIQYKNVRPFSSTVAPFHNFEIILYPNGNIVYQYLSQASLVNSATIGIQNAARTDGLRVVYNAPYVHPNLAIRIAAAPEWLSANPGSGTVAPGGTATVNVLFNADGLFGGRYEGNVIVNTNDPVAPQVLVPATLNVTGVEDIVLNPTSIDFGEVFTGYTDLHTFSIGNAGTDILTVNSVVSDNPEFTVDFSSLTLPLNLAPLQQALVTVRFAPTAPGLQTASLSIGSSDPDEGTSVVALQGTGRIPPEASVAPTMLHADLLTGETDLQSVTLSNTGGSDLEFMIESELAATSVIYPPLEPELQKGETDPRPGVLGSGGPDAFGYFWRDSDETGGPIFAWMDVSGTGTPVFGATTDDGNLGPFAIPFNFPFYGGTFNALRVCSNGWVSFTNTTTDYTNDPLPNSAAPENLLALFWDDLVVDQTLGGQVYVDVNASRAIIQYQNVRLYSGTTPDLNVQIVLYPNGTILYQYLTVGPVTTSATVGIQDAAKTDGLTVAYNTAYVHDGLALKIQALPEWLRPSPAAGTVPPGGSVVIDALFDAADLFGGDYAGELRINTNDPAHGLLVVDATLHVTGVPRVAWAPEPLEFGTLFVGYPSSLNLLVRNVGTDHLSIASIIPGLPDYTVVPSSLELEPLQTATVSVTFDPTTDGDRSTTLAITSNDPDSPHHATVTGAALYPPIIGVSPDSLPGAAPPGGSKTKSLIVCNEGGSDLTFTVAVSELGASSVTVYNYVDVPKETDEEHVFAEQDPRPGILGTGGPDAFGYSWTDSDEPGGPTFGWVDVSGVGTPIAFPAYVDDGNAGPSPIGFSFPFYGNTFTDFRACSNGWVSFTSTSTSYTNQPLPNSGAPENLLAPFWDDMVYDEDYGASAYYHYDGTRTIIQFNNIRRIATYTEPFYSYEIILYPNGDIVYQYLTLGATTNSATIGIQNAAMDDGLTVAYNTAYVHADMAIRFSSRPPWLTVTPEFGVVTPGSCPVDEVPCDDDDHDGHSWWGDDHCECDDHDWHDDDHGDHGGGGGTPPPTWVTLAVTMDATDLEPGTYYGQIVITSNDPETPTVVIPVVFHVGLIEVAYSDIDPNTIRMNGRGHWVSSCVQFPTGYNVCDVDVSTVTFNDEVAADTDETEFDDCNEDHHADIQFRFPRNSVEAILEAGDAVEVWVTGELRDLTWFVAHDVIRVIRPRMLAPNGGEVLAGGQSVNVTWENPQGSNPDHATLYFSPDDGANWELVADQIVGTSYSWQVPVTVSEAAKLRVDIADGQGVMGYDTNNEPFQISSPLATEFGTPTVFALLQNAPNPFGARTAIAFDLPQAAPVDLKIYDVTGRLVRAYTPGEMPAGRHEIVWDGTSATGDEVAAGMYIYRVEAGAFQATKRMFRVQ